ncbi:GyrI-like domain-containing protein [Patescibacteria group bacterium]|nr:GyrI-like domain-containing protein [Patescibacteria group bacterium]
MKKALKIFAIIILVIAIGLAATALYHGMFSNLTVEVKEMGPYKMIYAPHQGSYYKVGEVSDKLYTDMVANGVESDIGIGVYYDDPAKVEESDLRSEIGILVDEKPEDKLIEQYEYKEIAQAKSAVIEFPIKSTLSYMFAPAKVYPAFVKYGEENNIEWNEELGSIEIYDIPAKKIIYIMAVK